MEHISLWQAALLGLIQGLTEFIPVSSSAHLNIAHAFLGQKERQFTFDLMLNLGTLAALMWYFRKDWLALLTDKSQQTLRNMVFLGCVPAAIAGLLLRDAEEKLPIFTDVRFNAIMLVVMGALLWLADVVSRKTRNLDEIGVTDAVAIGLSQALALVPGVSRSGSTITMGLLRGLNRESAARFSFLMSLPIMVGAVSFEALSVVKKGNFSAVGAGPLELLIGVVVAGISGYWAIDFLLNYLRTRGLALFFFWRLAVAIAVFLFLR